MTLAVLRGVSKVYGTQAAAQRALHGLDLTLYERDYVALMGPSGCGKSTLLHVLGLLDSCTRGRYELMGRDVTQLSVARQAQLRSHAIGFVFQGYNLLNRTTALENVELPLVYRGLRPRERHPRALRALATVGLEAWAHHTPGELSGGQQQRVAIARAIVTEPTVILADEPTGNLDAVRSREIMDLLAALNREQQITIVMVTHEADMAAYARRIVHFVDGLVASDQREPARA
jgi:putative ABC transport system ATP-binding protein